jgi:hypothetical protein
MKTLKQRNILEIITNSSKELSKKLTKKLSIISETILTMNGRITMVGISRWTENLSYKTVERFFDEKINWIKINFELMKLEIESENLLIIDEVIVPKSGKSTYGIGKFYSTIQKQPISSIAFSAISIVNIEKERSFPLFIKQIFPTTIKKEEESKSKDNQPKKRGRPKDSKNKNNATKELTSIFKSADENIKKVMDSVEMLKIRYLIYDGAFGNSSGVQVAKQNNLELISKLRRNSALFLKFYGKQKSRGRKRIYDEKLDFNNIDKKFLVEEKIEDDIKTEIFQLEVISKKIKYPLNIVIIMKTNLKTKQSGYNILFSTDLDLGFEKIIKYYSLRFKIEFDFRDAKQFFGLDDFMNIKENHIHNFANLSLFMKNIAYIFAKEHGLNVNSINDLKSRFTALKYINRTLKFMGKTPYAVFNSDILNQIADFSIINSEIS